MCGIRCFRTVSTCAPSFPPTISRFQLSKQSFGESLGEEVSAEPGAGVACAVKKRHREAKTYQASEKVHWVFE